LNPFGTDLGIYIHIPFCDHKCIYCDFYSIISYENTEMYHKNLLREIELRSKSLFGRKVKSIYFGGGTPSFMSPEYIGAIINKISKHFDLDKEAEITLETNPGTVDKSKLIEFRKRGINRISIGIQSFDKDELKFLTRIHDSEQAVNTVLQCAEAGFDNISIDLIFNLPGQNSAKWRKNLEIAVKLPVKHISAYSLILEKGTILNKMVIDGKVKMQEEDIDAGLFEETMDFLGNAGFPMYEISNYAVPGFECRHNQGYWDYNDYIGFGTSAHSFVFPRRSWNYSALTFYNLHSENKDLPESGFELIEKEQMSDEYIMLALRSRGLNTHTYSKLTGRNFIEEKKKFLIKLKDSGYLTINGDLIKLTPGGCLLADEIIGKLV